MYEKEQFDCHAFAYQKYLPNVFVKYVGKIRASDFSILKKRNNPSSLFKKESVRIQISLSRAWNFMRGSFNFKQETLLAIWRKFTFYSRFSLAFQTYLYLFVVFPSCLKQIFPTQQLFPECNILLVLKNLFVFLKVMENSA